MKLAYKLLSKIMGRNISSTPKEVILEQMAEKRPLPMNIPEFDEWSERLISGALVPGADPTSQKFALASMILHLPPTQSHCEDAYFIHSLRRAAVNQVCIAIMDDLKKKREAEQATVQAADEALKQAAEATLKRIEATNYKKPYSQDAVTSSDGVTDATTQVPQPE